MKWAIDVQDLVFTHKGAKKPTLDIPKLTIPAGKRYFIFGPSGCGKTTLLETLVGVLVPQQGKVEVCETNLFSLSPSSRDFFRAAHVGYIFQSFNLIPYLNVVENITLPLYLNSFRRQKIKIKDENQTALNLCERLGIQAFLQKPVLELSVGQQQRVAAARALIGNPEILLADEPTSSLDHDHREKFIQLLFELCDSNNTTVLFVSHDKSLEKLFDDSISLPALNKALA